MNKGDVVAHGGDFDGWHSQSAFSPERKAGFVFLTNGENGIELVWKEPLKSIVDDFVFLWPDRPDDDDNQSTAAQARRSRAPALTFERT